MEEATDCGPDNLERFLAMGGGSFELLLEMVGGNQPSRMPGSLAWVPQGYRGASAGLPRGYRLEHDPDALILRLSEGTFVAAFSSRGAAGEAIVRVVEEDLRGLPAYCGPERYTGSARRLIEARVGQPWERFLQTQRQALEARCRGRMAKALSWRLPGESPDVLHRIASEDRIRAEEGLVELGGGRNESSFKHIEELSPDDRMDRIRAELVLIEWLMERPERRMIMRFVLFNEYQSRRSVS